MQQSASATPRTFGVDEETNPPPYKVSIIHTGNKFDSDSWSSVTGTSTQLHNVGFKTLRRFEKTHVQLSQYSGLSRTTSLATSLLAKPNCLDPVVYY
jgi:hypothetical protein